jgi:glucosamine 6-phosphate synthetase-like amidotransferase/phosphosugar isomerase protein
MIRGDFKDYIRQMPVFINQCLTSQKSKIKKISEILSNETSILIVGKGPSYAIAKSVTYSLIFFEKQKII